MKRLFAIFIPLCILSFIAFGISVAIMGVRARDFVTDIVTAVDVHSGESEWEISSPYSSISLEIGAGSVEVMPISGTVTTFSLSNDACSVESSVDDDTLYVRFGGEDIGAFFEQFGEAISNGFDFSDMFKTNKLTIGIPQQIYDRVDVELGAGGVTLNGIRAQENYFDIGAGSFEYTGGSDFTANYLNVNMGSGYTEITGLPTENYEINIGSGSFKIGDISGNGNFHMGSGSGILGLAELNGDNDIEVSSGGLTVQIPADAKAEVTADIGSGSVSVNACGQNVKLHDGNSIMLGEVSSDDEAFGQIEIELGSGSVKINNEDFTSEVTVAGDTTATAATAAPTATTVPVEEQAA